jgi:hypothetical protein
MDRDCDLKWIGIVVVFLAVEMSELKIGEVWWKYEEI